MKPPAEYLRERTEFQRRRNLPGVTVRHMNSRRTSDIVLTLEGREIGSRTEITKRGKVVSITFNLPELVIHLLAPDCVSTACGKPGESHADINRVTCDACIHVHDTATW